MTTAITLHIDAASENVRAANHATMRPPLDAAETSPVVGGLAELLGRLPQVLDYVYESLLATLDPAEHYDDRDRDPGHTVCLSLGRLEHARASVHEACEHLNAAHNHVGHLGRRLPKD